MHPKTKLLALLCASFLGAGESASFENEVGLYSLLKPQNTYSYDQRNSACKALGAEWAVPNIEELFNAPAALRAQAEKSLYASSTKNHNNDDEIYYHSFDNKDVNIVSKNENLFLICFKPSGKKTTKKSVIWGKSEQSRMNFKEAKEFCENKGARLPSSQELFSIAIFKVFNEKEYSEKYGFTQPKYYWSGETNDDFSNTAIVVGFLKASVASSSKDNRSFVRCVIDAK
jgi:hypothetical protein